MCFASLRTLLQCTFNPVLECSMVFSHHHARIYAI